MDLGTGPQESISLSTMPIPAMNYGPIQESAKFRILSGPHASLAASINGPHQLNVSSAPVAAPPGPPQQLLPRPPPAPTAATHIQQLSKPAAAEESASHVRSIAAPGGKDNNSPDLGGIAAASGLFCPPPAAAPGSSTHGSLPANPGHKPVRYRECLKNHAASIGGHALDGCGDFMPSGDEGSLEALKCAACGCHRNFHRREVEGEAAPLSVCSFCAFTGPRNMMIKGTPTDQHQSRRRLTPLMAALPPHTPLALPPPISPAVAPPGGPSRAGIHLGAASVHSPPEGSDHDVQLQMNGPPHLMGAQTMHHHHHFHSASSMTMKKRFRTKFSSEQKDKMFSFAEKLGWRIQKHDEATVHQFCAEVGVKRHVFKVWMHNNKNTFSKKISLNDGVAYLDNGASSPTTSSGNNNMQP